MQSNERHLKNLVINSGLQFRIILTSLIYMMLLLVITTGIILYPLLHDMFLSQDLNLQYQSAQSFLSLIKQILPAGIILFSLFFIHLTIITHRICGPLINFTKTFSRMQHGDFSSKVKLRKGDYLKYECDKINEMIDTLSMSIKSARDEHQYLLGLLEEASENIDNPELSKKINDAVKNFQRIEDIDKASLNFFKIETK